MKIQFSEDGTLTIILEGSFNADNAPDIGKKLLSAINRSNPSAIVYDFSSLNYISSAGLREMLVIKKKNPLTPITITGVNNVVYDILRITGFADFYMVYNAGDRMGGKRVKVPQTNATDKKFD